MSLKKCPFCDGNAQLISRQNVFKEVYHSIKCNSCGIRTTEFDTVGEAVSAWNRRPIQYGVWVPGIRKTGDAYFCSICGCRWNKPNKQSCPNCGTTMVSKQAFLEWKGFPNKIWLSPEDRKEVQEDD